MLLEFFYRRRRVCVCECVSVTVTHRPPSWVVVHTTSGLSVCAVQPTAAFSFPTHLWRNRTKRRLCETPLVPCSVCSSCCKNVFNSAAWSIAASGEVLWFGVGAGAPICLWGGCKVKRLTTPLSRGWSAVYGALMRAGSGIREGVRPSRPGRWLGDRRTGRSLWTMIRHLYTPPPLAPVCFLTCEAMCQALKHTLLLPLRDLNGTWR